MSVKEKEKLKSKLKITKMYLKRLFEELVKPLFQEIKIKDEIIERQNKKIENLQQDIKMMNSILRVPRMCNEF